MVVCQRIYGGLAFVTVEYKLHESDEDIVIGGSVFGPKIRFLPPSLPVVSQFSQMGPCQRTKLTYESILRAVPNISNGKKTKQNPNQTNNHGKGNWWKTHSHRHDAQCHQHLMISESS